LFNISGIKSDIILKCGQNNECDVIITCDAEITGVKYNDNQANVCALGDNRFRITGIPVGGPYIITLEFASFRRECGPVIGYGQVYRNVYVG